jgi:hypothetical protein
MRTECRSGGCRIGVSREGFRPGNLHRRLLLVLVLERAIYQIRFSQSWMVGMTTKRPAADHRSTLRFEDEHDDEHEDDLFAASLLSLPLCEALD